MSEEIVLKEEILEKEAYKIFSQKVADEYDLNMSLTNAMMGYIQINDEETRKDFELTTIQRIELEEKWLRLKVKSTKARRDFEATTNHNMSADELKQIILPIFDQAVLKAEDELNRHLKKYGTE